VFPHTASPATALTIAAMMNSGDIAAADARRVAHDIREACRAENRRRSPARNELRNATGFRSTIWRWRSGVLARPAR
jgi:hypothetical protein